MRKTPFLLGCCLLFSSLAEAQTAWQLDGVDDYAEVTDYPALHRGVREFTLEATVDELDFTSSNQLTLLDKRNATQTQGIYWAITPSTLEFQIENQSLSVPHSLTAGCRHLAVVRLADKVEFFVNGNSVALSTIPIATNMDSPEPLFIGCSAQGASFFHGQIDELRIWKKARTAADLNLYKNTCLPLSQQTADLIAYWNLDENSDNFGNNLASFAHYARMGGSLGGDTQEPKWTNSNCVLAGCCAGLTAGFTLPDSLAAGDTLVAYNTTVGADSIWWIINATDTVSSSEVGMGSLIYVVDGGDDLLQLIAFGSGCRSVLTKILSVNYLPIFTCTGALPNPCDNLVCQGDFEAYQQNVQQQMGYLPHFTPYSFTYGRGSMGGNSADLYYNFADGVVQGSACVNTPPVSSMFNQTVYAGIINSPFTQTTSVFEGFHLPLQASLQPGIPYVMEMRVATLCPPQDIFVVFGENAPISGGGMYSLATPAFNASNIPTGTLNTTASTQLNARELVILPNTLYSSTTGTDLNWQTIAVTFTVTAANLDHIFITLRPFNDTIGYVLMDDIVIREAATQYTIAAPGPYQVCPGQTVTIPYTLTSQTGAVVDFNALIPAGATIVGGDFSAQGQLNNITIPAGGSTTVNLVLQFPTTGTYTFQTTAQSAGFCTGNLQSASVTVNVGGIPPPTVVINNLQVTSVGNNWIVSFSRRICSNAPAGSGATSYQIQANTPNGWTQLNPNATAFTYTLTPGACSPWVAFAYRIPKNTNLCNLDIEACIHITATCMSPFTHCVELPTAQMGLPSFIPMGMSFSAAQTAGLLQPSGTAGQNVLFLGNHSQDIPYYSFVNSTVQMGGGATITLSSGTALEINNSTVQAGCGELWNSIDVRPNTKFISNTNSTIRDGLYAVQARGNAALYINNTTFDRNYVGIYIPANTVANTVFFGDFSANTFRHLGPNLLPTTSWTPPVTLDKRAYSGILMYNQALFNITQVSGAILPTLFTNMTNGIVAYDCNINLQKTPPRFANMSNQHYPVSMPRGNGIYTNGQNGNYYTTLSGFGNANGSTVAFTNCVVGIHNIRTKLRATNHVMTLMQTGIQISRADAREALVEHNRIQANLNGINLLLQNDNPALTTIQFNNITIHNSAVSAVHNGNPAGAAIAVNGGATVNGNILIAQNTITQHRANHGIFFQSQIGGTIEQNSINLLSLSNAPFNNFQRRGIGLFGCARITVRCNSVSSMSNPINNTNQPIRTWGMRVENSPNCTHSCNEFTKTDIGMEFDGDCRGGAFTTVRGNVFGDHWIGLRYSNNSTKTGAQADRGNLWTGTYGFAAAVHLSPSFQDWLNSQYLVDVNNPQQAPLNIVPSQYSNQHWFRVSNNSAYTCTFLTVGCSAPALLSNPPVLRALDTTIALSNQPNTPDQWAMRRMLYEKLDKNPQWNQGIFAQFYNQQSTTALADVYTAEEQRLLTVVLDTPIVEEVYQYDADIEATIDTLLWLDSLYQSQPDTAYFSQRALYLAQLSGQLQNATVYTEGVQSDIVAKSQVALAVNTGINSSFIVEQNEKRFNEIYLQTAAIGNSVFSSAQQQQLESIALQCPHQGGTVVYRARSLYQLIETRYFEDNCTNIPQYRMQENGDSVICYDTVRLSNPSLEGPIDVGLTPPGWNTCRFTPDTFPLGSLIPASDGNSYVNLASLGGNSAGEAIGQMLGDTLRQGQTYGMLVDITFAAPPWGGAQGSIWLGNFMWCDEAEMIHLLEPRDTFWQTDTIIFTPSQDYTHIVFTSNPQANTGSIFIDNIRPLPFACDTLHSATPVVEPSIEVLGNALVVYPNPNSGNFSIEYEGDANPDRIEIVDALGRVVFVETSPALSLSQTFHIENIPNGFYTLVLRQNAQIVARAKLVVAK